MALNFNHPLAGKDLTFNVKILKIENAPAFVSNKTGAWGPGFSFLGGNKLIIGNQSWA